MKRTLMFLCSILMTLTTMAQTEEVTPTTGTRFIDNEPLDSALVLAKVEGKMAFVDCYATWCGPCKMMTRDVFPLPKVGDFMNAHFVSLKVDMEKGEGPELAKKYEVQAYPTFLILDAEGKEINRLVGSNTPDEFVKAVEEAMKGSRIPELEARWNAGDRSVDFLKDYYKTLLQAYKRDQAQKVGSVLIDGKTTELLTDSVFFEIWMMQSHEPQEESFQYLWQHKDDVKAKYGDGVVNHMENVWFSWPTPQNIGTMQADSTYIVNKQKLNDYKLLMERMNISECDNILSAATVNIDLENGNWKDFVKKAEKHMKKYDCKDMTLLLWVIRARNCEDPEICNTVAAWAEQRVQQMEKPTKEGTVRAASMYTNVYKTYAEQLRKKATPK